MKALPHRQRLVNSASSRISYAFKYVPSHIGGEQAILGQVLNPGRRRSSNPQPWRRHNSGSHS
jgi:hypothetical protein